MKPLQVVLPKLIQHAPVMKCLSALPYYYSHLQQVAINIHQILKYPTRSIWTIASSIPGVIRCPRWGSFWMWWSERSTSSDLIWHKVLFESSQLGGIFLIESAKWRRSGRGNSILRSKRPGRNKAGSKVSARFLRWVAGSRCEYSLPWAFPQERNTNGRISMTWTKLQLPLTCVQTKPCKALCNHSKLRCHDDLHCGILIKAILRNQQETSNQFKLPHPFSYQLLASNNLLEEICNPSLVQEPLALSKTKHDKTHWCQILPLFLFILQSHIFAVILIYVFTLGQQYSIYSSRDVWFSHLPLHGVHL